MLDGTKRRQIKFLDFLYLSMELWVIFWFFESSLYLFFTRFKVEPIIIQVILSGITIYIFYGLTTGIVFGSAYFLFQKIKKNRIQEKKIVSITATIFIFTLMFMHTFDLLKRHAGITSLRLIYFFSIIGIVAINFFFALVVYLFLQKNHSQNKQGIAAISLSICFSLLIAGGYIINNYFLSEMLNWQSILINILFFLFTIILYFLLNKFLRFVNKNKDCTPFYFKRSAYYSLLLLWLTSCCILIFFGNSKKYLSMKNIQKNIQNNNQNNLSESAHVILITMDALRADHISCYGYRNIKTPSIDSIAERGMLFNQVISQSPWTLPSFASIFTSNNPSVHDGGRILWQGGDRLITRIIPDIPVLPEILQERGYVTGAFISNAHLVPFNGFARGFDNYFNFDSETGREGTTFFLFLRNYRNILRKKDYYKQGKMRSGIITEKAMEWIESHAKTPFFLWIHYLDPHIPYEGYKESKVFNNPIYNNIRNKMDVFLGEVSSDLIRRGTFTLNSLEKRLLGELYDEEIAETDVYIGKVLKKLRMLDLEDKTLIVFTSDHGEEFFEHNNFEHGHSLYDEVIRVPLIFQYPKILQNKIIHKQVRSIDIMPTILELLNISPQDEIEGISLVPLMKSQDDKIEVRPAISEFLYFFEEKKSIRTENFKLIFHPESKKIELYNIKKDPLEINNIHTINAETSEILFERLNNLLDYSLQVKNRLTKGKASNIVKPDQMLLDRLKAIGYI